MTAPRGTFTATRSILGTYDGDTLGWLVGDATMLSSIDTSQQFVDDLSGTIIGTRGDIDVVVETSGDSTYLVRDPLSSIPSIDTSSGSPAVVVVYEETGSDATRKLLAWLTPDGGTAAGFDGWEFNPTNGIAKITPGTATPDGLPDQSGNAGKFLGTNGTDTAWDRPSDEGVVVAASAPMLKSATAVATYEAAAEAAGVSATRQAETAAQVDDAATESGDLQAGANENLSGLVGVALVNADLARDAAAGALLLSPLTASGAPTNAGPGTLLGFGSDPTPYEGGPMSAETIPADAWEGLKIAGQMRSTVGGSFPSAGFEFGVDLYIARRTYNVAGEWIEAMTVHSYTLGDSNELHDWLEIAAVHDDPDLDTLRFGIDLRLNGETIEYSYKTTARPLRFNTWQHLAVALDPATAEITVTVDDVEIESGVPIRGGDPMDTPTLPCTLSTPDAGADILLARGAVIIGKVTLNEYGDPPVTLCDPADGTDGALSFTSGGRDWVTWQGRVAGPFSTRRLMSGPWSNPSTSFDIGADDSFTWVITDVLLGYDYEFFDGVFLWGRNAMAVFGAGVGWGMLLAPVVGVPFGFGVTSSGAGGAALAQADAVPQGRCTIAAVLDRDTDELRLYVATATGLELLDTVDASGVGAVAPSADTQAQVVPEMGGHYLTYRRALTPVEITHLALSAASGYRTSGGSAGGGLELGETSTTAYRGDRGKTAYDHSQVVTGNPHGTTASDVGAVAASIVDAKGDLIVATAADTPARLAVGANGSKLVANSGASSGMEWRADPYIVTCPGATPTLLAAVTNYAFAMRVQGSGTISKIGLQIGTSSGNVCVAVYSSTGTAYNAVPDARLATSGSVACPSSGWAEISLGGSVDVKTGDWFAIAFDNNTATMFGVAAPGSGLANHGLSRAQAAAFPLPSTFTPGNGDRQVRLWGIP